MKLRKLALGNLNIIGERVTEARRNKKIKYGGGLLLPFFVLY